MIREMLKEPFTVGVDPYPDWFRKLDQNSVDFKVSEDTGELISLNINLAGNIVTAKAGDLLGLVNNQIVSIPVEAAKKYM